jgi:hypothetical protein
VGLRAFVYQRNIERICGGTDAIEEEIVHQLTEEARHVLLRPAATPADDARPDDTAGAGKKARKKAAPR